MARYFFIGNKFCYPDVGLPMNAPIEKSYLGKLGFYALVLALPLILMTSVVAFAPESALSPLESNPSRFLFFVVYFLPGLILARKMTESWRKTLGVGMAYAFISPVYYYYAADYACRLTGSCISV